MDTHTASRPVATQLLRDDHKIVRGLFRQAEIVDKRAPEMKEGVVRETLALLELHSALEEEIFYPAIRDATEPGDPLQALVADSFQDHAALAGLIAQARAGLGEIERLGPALRELIDATEEHLAREESDLFLGVERRLGPLLVVLGDRMRMRREQLLAEPRFADAHAERAQDPHGGEQMRRVG